MKIKNKRKAFELFFLAITVLIVISVVVLNNIILLSPYGIIYDRTPVLSWSGFEREYRLVIDEKNDFSNPIVDVFVSDNSFDIKKSLDFGKYYWKVISDDKESITGFFIVDSMIKIEAAKRIRNKGNTPVLISGITGRTILDVEEEMLVQEGENYTIKQI